MSNRSHSSVGSTPENPNDRKDGDEVQSQVQVRQPNISNRSTVPNLPPPLVPHPSDGDGPTSGDQVNVGAVLLRSPNPNAGPSVPLPQGNPNQNQESPLDAQRLPQPTPPPREPIDYQLIFANYQYQCPVCKYRFFNQNSLNGHMRFHRDGDGPATGNHQVNAGAIVLRSPELNAGPSVPHIVPQPPPPPRQQINYQEIIANYQYKCEICKERFHNQHGLNGHMRFHTDRTGRGLKPPPVISMLPPTHGSTSFSYPKQNYNPHAFNSYGAPLVIGGSGVNGLLNYPPAFQWGFPQGFDYQFSSSLGAGASSMRGGVGGSGSTGERQNKERDATRDPGKQQTVPQPPSTQQRSKRTTRPIPDLNHPPPKDDESDESQEGEGGQSH